jgi:hypothetical protein
MKRRGATGNDRRMRLQVVTPRRIWRVFEYRRPVPAAPRFTT